MSRLERALRNPLPLPPNRPPRFYRGGRELEAFRGLPDPADDDRPEDWVGSATMTWTPPGAPPSVDGPSLVDVGGEQLRLDELLSLEPVALAGAKLVERAGPTLGVLVKLLDAAIRLPVHCHPTRAAANRLLGSPFGKSEAWVILGTRPQSDARVWAGFREPVPAARLRQWIDTQATEPLLDSLSEYKVAVGDVVLIPGGTPHAIGPGVFLLELQEPTDFSVVAETRGFPITPADASLGLGWDRAIQFFDTDPPAAGLRQAPRPAATNTVSLLGPDADPYFRALRQTVTAEAGVPFQDCYAVGVVVSGHGSIEGADRRLALRRGSTFALPAAATTDARISALDSVELIWCLGPVPEALDA